MNASAHRPSTTMQAVCAARVKHQLADPIANAILKDLPEAADFLEQLDSLSQGMFSRTIVMRTQFFSNVLEQYEDEFEQLVILCSGIDFRYLQYGKWKERPTFLIDQPHSIELISPLVEPYKGQFAHTHWVPMDLVAISRTEMLDQLEQVNLDPKKKTLFLWEGASYYFLPKLIFSIIETIASVTRHSAFAIDFVHEGSFRQTLQEKANNEANEVDETLHLLKNKQEPWYGFVSKTEIANHFINNGYLIIQDLWDFELEQQTFGRQIMVPNSMFYMLAGH